MRQPFKSVRSKSESRFATGTHSVPSIVLGQVGLPKAVVDTNSEGRTRFERMKRAMFSKWSDDWQNWRSEMSLFCFLLQNKKGGGIRKQEDQCRKCCSWIVKIITSGKQKEVDAWFTTLTKRYAARVPSCCFACSMPVAFDSKSLIAFSGERKENRVKHRRIPFFSFQPKRQPFLIPPLRSWPW
jgi:hypothetical protein